MLNPIFDNIPLELRRYHHWIVWKDKKVPYDPTRPNSKANVTDPYSWGTLDQADAAYSEGGWDGVGFVLTGNGIAGVDLDNCVIDGVLNPDAMQFLEDIDAAYIEYSPSGNGVHALGFAKNLYKGVSSKLDGLSVELYTSKRYLTVTGHVIKNEPFRELNRFHNFAKKIRPQSTEDTNSHSLVPSVPSVSSVSDGLIFPDWTSPNQIDKRNKAIFKVARWLKGIEPEATRERQYEVIRAWFVKHLGAIGTKNFDETWVDFRNAWHNVENPYGVILNQCLLNLPAAPEIPALVQFGPKAVYLIQICIALQLYHGDKAFFLSARMAAALIGGHFTAASSLLRTFVNEGWLEEVSKGAGSIASRYRCTATLMKTLPLRGLL